MPLMTRLRDAAIRAHMSKPGNDVFSSHYLALALLLLVNDG
jgi:hypothetical protein